MGEKGAYSTMKFIELSQEQQRIVFTQASAQTGINVNLAEKDWWICQVLAALYIFYENERKIKGNGKY